MYVVIVFIFLFFFVSLAAVLAMSMYEVRFFGVYVAVIKSSLRFCCVNVYLFGQLFKLKLLKHLAVLWDMVSDLFCLSTCAQG